MDDIKHTLLCLLLFGRRWPGIPRRCTRACATRLGRLGWAPGRDSRLNTSGRIVLKVSLVLFVALPTFPLDACRTTIYYTCTGMQLSTHYPCALGRNILRIFVIRVDKPGYYSVSPDNLLHFLFGVAMTSSAAKGASSNRIQLAALLISTILPRKHATKSNELHGVYHRITIRVQPARARNGRR